MDDGLQLIDNDESLLRIAEEKGVIQAIKSDLEGAKPFFDGKGYMARYQYNHKRVNLGVYDSQDDAIEAIVQHRLRIFIRNIVSHKRDLTACVLIEKKYFIWPDGAIFNSLGIIMKPRLSNQGYVVITLNRKMLRVHRLIATAFIPNPNNLPEVNHKDGNKQNNEISNLEWVTRSENVQHAYQTGLAKNPGGRSVLTDDEKRYIRDHYLESSAYIANTLGRGQHTILKYLKDYREQMGLDENYYSLNFTFDEICYIKSHVTEPALEIAKTLNRSLPIVCKYLQQFRKEVGLGENYRSGGLTLEEKEYIKTHCNDTLTHIAECLDRSENTIYYHLRKYRKELGVERSRK